MSTSKQEPPEAGGSCATWSLMRASTRGSGARRMPAERTRTVAALSEFG